MKYVTLQNVIMKLELYTLTLILVSSGITAIPNDTKGIDNDADTHLSRFIADLWLEGSDIVRIIWRDCSKKLVDVKDVIDHKEYYPKFVRCMKRKTLRALDRCLSPDVVPLADGVNLVRFELVDHSGNVLHDNETSSWTEKELEEGEWRNLALQRMAKVLRTHVIKFDFEEDNVVDKVEYRGRRRHHMMTMMMFGIVSIGMVLIPMGFQFLAVLGGKALLLAKMALILASIQGLKKIATSPLSYGFYNTYPYDHFERSRNWPPSPVVPRSTNAHNPFTEAGDIQADRTNIAEHVFEENIKNKREIKRNMNVKAVKDEDRQFPVYTEVLNLPHPSIFTVVDAPSPLVDLTTRPGEVQADYALDLPYNGFHFQGSNPVVPA
ncbi:uncharacterized protein Osi23 isoform X2 [Maniola hyperantus]|uniref:uncharacterized protein Osi23 isoform X2 n=1 Tax=Aphantopus hyperantus TaxID=2795564 RepID=UPI0015685C7C|nr:uncharacterized protein LOC117987020 isoform X1 [Maniola hyperantus]